MLITKGQLSTNCTSAVRAYKYESLCVCLSSLRGGCTPPTSMLYCTRLTARLVDHALSVCPDLRANQRTCMGQTCTVARAAANMADCSCKTLRHAIESDTVTSLAMSEACLRWPVAYAFIVARMSLPAICWSSRPEQACLEHQAHCHVSTFIGFPHCGSETYSLMFFRFCMQPRGIYSRPCANGSDVRS